VDVGEGSDAVSVAVQDVDRAGVVVDVQRGDVLDESGTDPPSVGVEVPLLLELRGEWAPLEGASADLEGRAIAAGDHRHSAPIPGSSAVVRLPPHLPYSSGPG
jgi:hypothetical protein